MKEFIFSCSMILWCWYLALWVLGGCTSAPSKSIVEHAIESTQPTIEQPTVVQAVQHNIKFNPVTNYNATDLKVLAVAERLGNELFQSQCFADFMTNRDLIQTNEKTSVEVVRDLKAMKLELPLKMYTNWFTSTKGYRNPGSPIIYTNRKYHAGSTACSRGSNLFHEATHVGGYGHDKNASKTRPFSVPYSVNAAFEVCCSCKSVTDCAVKP